MGYVCSCYPEKRFYREAERFSQVSQIFGRQRLHGFPQDVGSHAAGQVEQSCTEMSSCCGTEATTRTDGSASAIDSLEFDAARSAWFCTARSDHFAGGRSWICRARLPGIFIQCILPGMHSR